MSAPAPTPQVAFNISVECQSCNTELHDSLSSTEQQAKENFTKALTAWELHDCRSAPKSAKP